MNPGGRHMTGVRMTIKGDSDNTNSFPTSFWHHTDNTNDSIIDLLEGILKVKDNGRVGILTDKHFLHQHFRGQPGELRDLHWHEHHLFHLLHINDSNYHLRSVYMTSIPLVCQRVSLNVISPLEIYINFMICYSL